MTETPANPENPAWDAKCPRCGYDLAGEVGRWADVCPLDGLCPECGLGFEWRDLFDPRRQVLTGFVEHARGWKQTAWWCARTCVWAFTILVFWRRVKMHHRIDLRRAAAAMLGAALVLWLLGGVLVAFVAMANFASGSPSSTGAYAPGASVILPDAWAFDSFSWLDRFAWPALGFPIEQSAWYGRESQGVWFWRSQFIMVHAAGWIACAAAWPLLWAVLPATRRGARVRWAHIGRASVNSLVWLAIPLLMRNGAILCLYASDVFMPSRAGARPSFVPAGVSPMLISRALYSTGEWLLHGVWLGPIVAYFWLQAWWLCAITMGWKVQRGWLVWLLLTVGTTLAGVVVNVLLVLALQMPDF